MAISDSEPDNHAMSSPKNVVSSTDLLLLREGARPPEAANRPPGEPAVEEEEGREAATTSTGAVPKRTPQPPPTDEAEVAELKAKMLEILASKEQADSDLSALKKLLEEKNAFGAHGGGSSPVPPPTSYQVQCACRTTF